MAEPSRYRHYQEGQPVLMAGRRRPAGYFLKIGTRGPQLSLLEEEFVPLTTVDDLRERLTVRRGKGYPGATAISRQLLRHRQDPDRERGLFFCQLEAAETLIYLVEAAAAEKQGLNVPKDEPNDLESQAKGYRGLTRYAIRMATGSGKTVVMAMMMAWQVLNKIANPQERKFSDAVLVVCPNLTVRERLQVLRPKRPDNYYDKFDLLPPGFKEGLTRGRYLITNGTGSSPRMIPVPGVWCNVDRKATGPFAAGFSRSWAPNRTFWSSMRRPTTPTGPARPSLSSSCFILFLDYWFICYRFLSSSS